MKMKNIIFIIFALVIGVAEALGQTRELTGGTINTVTPAEGENTVTLNETLVIPTTGGPVTIYIPAGVTLDITGANAGDGGTGQDGTPSVTNAAGGSGGTAAMPAISVPLGATLIITGEGTLIAKGGNGGAGGNGGNGESGKANAVNDFAGAGGGGGGGGGGAAAAIGGAGGNGGAGANGAKYTEDALIGSSYGVSGDLGNAGSNGIAMGNVYIVGNVHVSTQGGQQSQTNTYYSRNYGLKGNFGTTGKKGSYYYHSGGYGYGGFDGSTPTYSIGGGGNGGRGGNSGKGGDVSKEASETISPIQYDTDYTPGAANNGTLYIQSTAFNAPDLGSSTHAQEVAVSTYAQMPSAIATTFTIDGESTPLRAIYYGTVIENMDLTTVEMTRTGYTFNGYKVKGTSTQVFDASGTFVYPITTIPSSTNPSLNMSLNAPGDIILEADWIPNTYTVTFDKQSGSGGDNTVTATYDSAMPSATAPTKSGYIFRGYYTEPDGGGTKYYNADMTSANDWDIADNQTLYALWVVPTFTITLNADGGSNGTSSVTVTFGSAMPSATAPTKANYTFMGYFTAENGAGTQYYYPDMSSKRVWDDDTGLINTLYAYWADCHTDKTIKVNYDSNGGYGTMEPQLVRLADNIKANIFIKGDATTHKQNYFSGWNTKADGTGRGYQPGDVIFATEEYSEITLYAQWDPTFNDIYVIATADDLLNFATEVNSGSTSIKGILATDIDMSGKIWTPIGKSSQPFQGIFDGNGYTVSNLTMADNASYDYAGLFGYAKNATIQNVIAKNVTLYAKYPMGAVCGRIDSEMSHATGGFLTRCGSFGSFNYNYRPTTPSQGESGGLATAETTNFEKGEISHIYSTNTAVEYVIGYFTSYADHRIPEKFNYKSSQASCTNGYLCYLLNESVVIHKSKSNIGANIATDSNGALIYGAGNAVTNSYQDVIFDGNRINGLPPHNFVAKLNVPWVMHSESTVFAARRVDGSQHHQFVAGLAEHRIAIEFLPLGDDRLFTGARIVQDHRILRQGVLRVLLRGIGHHLSVTGEQVVLYVEQGIRRQCNRVRHHHRLERLLSFFIRGLIGHIRLGVVSGRKRVQRRQLLHRERFQVQDAQRILRHVLFLFLGDLRLPGSRERSLDAEIGEIAVRRNGDAGSARDCDFTVYLGFSTLAHGFDGPAHHQGAVAFLRQDFIR